MSVMTMLSIGLGLLLGAATWTLIEYIFHRFLGHDRRFRPNFFWKEHTRHHIEGDYFAPWQKKASAAVIVTLVLGTPAVLIAGWALGATYVLGLVGFYGCYEALHSRDHTHAPTGPYGRWARRHHFSHHFTDARYNHGVTTPIWDHVFGTYRTVDSIRVPRRLAMTWLVDAETGEVHERFRAVWSLKGAPKKPAVETGAQSLAA